MQPNPHPAASSNKNTWLIVVICSLIAFVALPVIFFAGVIYFSIPEPKYKKQTAKAQPEIIEIKPTTWSESSSSTMGKPSMLSHQVDGYSISYKFNTESGETILQTDDKKRSKAASDMVQVCYDPKQPHNSSLKGEGNCP